MTAAIEIEGLRKVYRRFGREVVAVDHIDLEVPVGGVFGFLGPNGSGKTTTIRALTGILRRFDGSVRVLGADTRTELDSVIDRVGSLVETPSFFPAFSARRTLGLLARTRGIPAQRVDEALAAVGLAERAGDPIREYSLGMRQRLGVAAAIVKDPELLILDEPANGLDPDGMREMRLTLRRLAEQGRTVFVSSHLLAEVSQLCDRVAVLRKGRCVFAGNVDELVGQTGSIRVRVHGDAAVTEAAVAVIRDTGRDVTARDDGALSVSGSPDEAWTIVRALAAHDLWVDEITPLERTLEEGYVDLLHGEDGVDPGATW